MLKSKNQTEKRYFGNVLKNFCRIYTHMIVENYTKDLKESIYHGAVVSALAVGFTVLGKSLMKMSPPPPLISRKV